MTSLAVLLFVAGASVTSPLPAIAIDPCVEVDVDEVRRVAALELSTWQGGRVAETLEVVVACLGGLQEIRLTDRGRGLLASRSIDLNAPSGTDRDARARELALAIAELLRRVATDTPPLIHAETPDLAPPEPDPQPPDRGVRIPEREPFRAELGLSGVGIRWTGGQTLFGANASGRLRLGRFLLAELYLGGRRTQSIRLASGALDGAGVAFGAGVGFDVTPSATVAGLSFAARLGADWLRYAAVDREGLTYGGGDAGAVSAAGAATAFVALAGPLSLTADVAVGGALHSIAVYDNGQQRSGLSGALFSGGLGLAARY